MIRMPYQKRLKVPITFPAVMSKSRDYDAVELLLQSVFNMFYTESVESRNIHNPYRCDADLLPLLADFYRYSYTDVMDVDKEREIIATIPNLHHNKGTSTGIDNALALSLVDKTSGITIPWFYDRNTNIVTVIVFSGMETYKMLELLKLVIPLGTRVICKPGFLVKSSEEIKLHSWIRIEFGPLDPYKQYYVSPNNYWRVEWDPEKELYHTYVDAGAELSNPNNKDPQNIGINGATRYGSIEVAGNDVDIPGGKGED